MVAKKKSTTKSKSTVKKSVRRSSKSQDTYTSFKVSPDYPGFFEARVSKQTFYWSLLLLFIIIMQLVIIAVNFDSSLIVDQLNSK